MRKTKQRISCLLVLCMIINVLIYVDTGTAHAASIWDGSSTATNWSGAGSQNDPYLIQSAEELAGLAASVNAGENYANFFFKQTEDIDLNEHQWDPIGTSRTVYFAGNYDGGGHAISGLRIHAEKDYIGLFGFVIGSTIKNVNIVDASITATTGYFAGNYMGALIGAGGDVTVNNCYASGNIMGRGKMGGLIGHLYIRTKNVVAIVENCGTSVNLIGDESVNAKMIGGLIGYVDSTYDNNTIVISNNYATGNLSGGQTIGGFIGEVEIGMGTVTGSSILIDSCYATGDVSGCDSLGGFVSSFSGGSKFINDFIISNCYSTGDVIYDGRDSSNSYYYAGGFISGMRNGVIKNCYTAGYVMPYKKASADQSAPFISSLTNGTVENCYFDKELTSQTDGRSKGLTTSEMTGITAKTNMIGFDFEEIWITTNGYPEIGALSQNEVTVTFDLSNEIYEERPHIVGQSYVLPSPDPEKEGYLFDGWYYDDKFTNKVENNDLVTNDSDHTLYGQWLEDSNGDGIPDREQKYTVTEQYVDDLGQTIQESTSTVINGAQGALAYEKEAPTLSSFLYMGYQIGDGQLQTGDLVLVRPVGADFTVTYLYDRDSNGTGVPDREQKYTVTERYVDDLGQTIQEVTSTMIDGALGGLVYEKEAPELTGYLYVGYQIGEDPLQTAGTVSVRPVGSDFIVTYLYDRDSNGTGVPDREQKYTVTERYVDDLGQTIQEATSTVIDGALGTLAYEKEAPTLTGYLYVGYQIGEDPLQTIDTVSVRPVGADFTVTYLYDRDSNGTGVPDREQKYTVTERYVDDLGQTIQEATSTVINGALGALAYEKEAPELTGYLYVGYQIGEDPLQTAGTVSVRPVGSDFIVTYLYDRDSNGTGVPDREQKYTVTERYVDDLGQTIQEATSTVINGALGALAYEKEAPELTGYLYVGYQIGDGQLQTGDLVLVRPVGADFTVTYLYDRDSNGTGVPDREQKYIVTERYVDDLGQTVQEATSTVIDGALGALAYEKEAPTLTGYLYVGYQIGEDPLQTIDTVSVRPVGADFTVTYLYDRDSNGTGVPDREQKYTVTERYVDDLGQTIQEATSTVINGALGALAYEKEAPELTGYLYVGYQIGEDPLQTAGTVSVRPVGSDFIVTYLYDRDSNGTGVPDREQKYTVTERYVDDLGQTIQEATSTVIDGALGALAYEKEAPTLTGYLYVGYQIGEDPLQTIDTVSVRPVGSDFIVTYLYDRDSNGTGVPDREQKYTVTERYVDDLGQTIQEATSTVIDGALGALAYEKEAPTLTGYLYVGYQIGEDPLQTIDTVSVRPVGSDFIVTYLYDRDSNGTGVPDREQKYTVTERYVDDLGQTIQEATSTMINGALGGLVYEKEAPELTGYLYVGYQIGDGQLQTGDLVLVRPVGADFTVTYLYDRDSNGTGVPDREQKYIVTERYVDDLGQTIQEATSTVIVGALGALAYEKKVLELTGYLYTGYQIGDGQLQTGSTVSVRPIGIDFLVTYFYDRDTNDLGVPDKEQTYTIEERYTDEAGNAIAPNTEVIIDGEQELLKYQKNAPALKGWIYRGYRDVSGSFFAVDEVSIYPVHTNAVITFVYTRDYNEDGKPDVDQTFLITEKYVNESGVSLQGEAQTEISGRDGLLQYERKTAPSVSGHSYQGYIIADGELMDGLPVIDPIREDTVISYVFSKRPKGGGNGNSSKEEDENSDEDLNSRAGAYIDGYPDGTFRPDATITRAESAVVLFRVLEEKPVLGDSQFMDVAEDEWYSNAILTLTQKDVLYGYPDKTFRPDATITRAEFTAIVMRCFGNKEMAVSSSNPFVDLEARHWAYQDILSAIDSGWISGYEDKTFHPDDFISRAEAVVILNKATGRITEEDAAMDSMFIDLETGHWAFADIMEASK